MLTTGQTLFGFVDPKDPFMASDLAGEWEPGPILSMLAARPFQFLFLFHTPHTRQNAEDTAKEVRARHPGCRVRVRELPVSDPKDYSALMGRLAHEVRSVAGQTTGTSNFVCVSSGTAEMRAAWFVLTATGILPATLLQVGSPAEPLFGARNVQEVRFDAGDWQQLRDLVMPLAYFDRETQFRREKEERENATQRSARRVESRPENLRADSVLPAGPVMASRRTRPFRPADEEEQGELDEALRELNLYVGSAVMRDAAERAAIVGGESDMPVLLTGETGTGKEMFAKLIHRLSARRAAKMICVNCAAIPKDLVESSLFGHVKGAFTGATDHHKGKFEVADGSTLFLDEIGELPPEAQSTLLRVLQDGQIEPVGSNQSRRVDVRIVAATNRNLPEEIEAGRFRADLYFRLAVVTIELPPLRRRVAEIPQLATSLLQQINQRYRHPRQLAKDALQRLTAYPWPGNVRELSSVLQSSALFARDGVIGVEDLEFPLKIAAANPFGSLPEPHAGFDLPEFLSAVKYKMVKRAVEMSGGNQTTAAGLLGLTKQAVSQILKSGKDNGA